MRRGDEKGESGRMQQVMDKVERMSGRRDVEEVGKETEEG